MNWLVEPLSYAFFVRALAAGVVVGGMCGALGVFVVLRRMSYIGHGLSHSVLGGVAVGLALGVDLYVGAITATLLSALLIDRIARRPGLYPDTAIGIVTTAMFALGVAVISVLRVGRVNTESLLFGNVLGVRAVDLVLVLVMAGTFGLVLFLLYKPLLFTAFDAGVAAVQGVRAGLMEALFNVLVAGVVVVSVRVLGVLLVAAAVVVPAAAGRLLLRRFDLLLGWATAMGAVSALVGLYLSFHWRVPSGATIVLVGVAGFAACAVIAPLRERRRFAKARASG